MRDRPRPSLVDFGTMPWEKVAGGGAVGRTKRHVGPYKETIRVLELDPRWDEKDWCRKKHAGYVLSGALRLELEAGSPVTIRKGQGFYVPKGCAHRAGCAKVTRVFLVD